MKILVAVPAYNEEKNIKRCLDDLKKNTQYDIVVIDNGSYDDTKKICQNMNVKVISHCVNTGGSFGTLMTFCLYAYKQNYDVICQFDGDGQHIATELAKILEPIKNGEADYVIGSRFLKKEGFQSYFVRRIGIKLFAYIDSLITGQKLTDVTSGFRAYGKKTINFLARYYKHEIYDTSQLLLLNHFVGARIKEVPVKMKKRKFGESEFNVFNSIGFVLKGLVNIIGCCLQKNEIEKFVRNSYGHKA